MLLLLFVLFYMSTIVIPLVIITAIVVSLMGQLYPVLVLAFGA